MKEKIEPFFHIVALQNRPMLDNNITPIIKPIRGGTGWRTPFLHGIALPQYFYRRT
jgi:tripeptide aminopeptidase